MGRPSKGRQRIEIRHIKDADRREVTFSKRKSGLLKKGSELSLLCGAHVAFVVFSPGGRAFALGTPSVDHVLRRFDPLPGDEDDGDLLALLQDGDCMSAADRGAVEAIVPGRRRPRLARRLRRLGWTPSGRRCARLWSRPAGSSGGRRTWKRSGRLSCRSSPGRSAGSGTTCSATWTSCWLLLSLRRCSSAVVGGSAKGLLVWFVLGCC